MDRERVQMEQLWQTSAQRLRNFLLRLVGDIDTANDLLGQAFLEAARHWRRYRGKGTRQAWLFGIARNLARLEIRSRKARRTEPLPPDLPAAETPAASSKESDTARMWKAIEELPDHLRQTLTLRLADEMTYQEIAEASGIPIGTVRSRIHEAVGRLRRELSSAREEQK